MSNGKIKRVNNERSRLRGNGGSKTKTYRIGDAEKAFYVALVIFGVVFTGLMAHGAGFGSGIGARTARRAGTRTAAPMRRFRFENDGGSASGRRAVYTRAMWLQTKYDSRPYWPMPRLVAGAPVSRATADLAIEYLIPCESGGRPIDHLDSDGKVSYGILQFQDWEEWENISGIRGNPENSDDAIRMAEWGIEHGMIDHWGCAKVLRMM